jgi:hypothetical protein
MTATEVTTPAVTSITSITGITGITGITAHDNRTKEEIMALVANPERDALKRL